MLRRGVSRIFIMGFPPVKNYRNILGITLQLGLAADNINFTGLYAEVVDMHLCVPQTGVQAPSVCLLQEAWGQAPSRKFLKIQCQKREFGGISVYKVDFNITISYRLQGYLQQLSYCQIKAATLLRFITNYQLTS